MATLKTAYTAEQVAQLTELHTAGTATEAIAEALGKTTRSVIAKLAQLGLYEAAKRTPATLRVTKADLIQAIAHQLDVPAKALESLVKADKAALEILAKGV